MNKKEQLKKQAEELIKKAKEIEINEQQKIGKLVMKLYENKQIKDPDLTASIAKLIGDSESNPVPQTQEFKL